MDDYTRECLALTSAGRSAVEDSDLNREGIGVKSDPFRYWLPSLEEKWRDDPMARLQQTITDTLASSCETSRRPRSATAETSTSVVAMSVAPYRARRNCLSGSNTGFGKGQ